MQFGVVEPHVQIKGCPLESGNKKINFFDTRFFISEKFCIDKVKEYRVRVED
jgi:hypothetical protein